ncbi:MAG: hypothetical protein WBV28_24255 [Terracidiphilus sp.]
MAQEIKGIVRPPFRMPAETQGRRSQLAVKQAQKVKVPLLITLFAWYCFLRAAADLACAALVQLSPDSATAVFAMSHFNPIPSPIPPQVAFVVLAAFYTVVGLRWITRDWRAWWAALFVSGITVASSGYQCMTHRVIENPLNPSVHQSPVVPFVVNLLIFCYLAFYPGVAEAFKETSRK